jgi:hypothetical protein
MKTSIATLISERFAFADECETRIAALHDDEVIDEAVENMDAGLGVMDRLISELAPATLADLRAQLTLYRELVDWDEDSPAEALYEAMTAGIDRLQN